MQSRSLTISLLIAGAAVAVAVLILAFLLRGTKEPGTGARGDREAERPEAGAVRPAGKAPPSPAAEASPEKPGLPQAQASIHGVVSRPDGAPIRGARVSAVPLGRIDAMLREDAARAQYSRADAACHWLETQARGILAEAPSALTDAEGQYAIRELSPGPYRIVAEAEGFVTDTAAEVALFPGEARRIDFTLFPALAISGTVRAADGQVLEGANVRAIPSRYAGATGLSRILAWRHLVQAGTMAAIARETVTGAEGRFRLAGLDAGSYDIAAVAPGFAPGVVPNVPSGAEGLEVVLEPGAAIRGTVRLEGATDFGGVSAVAFELRDDDALAIALRGRSAGSHGSDGDSAAEATTDPSGRFLLCGLRATTHRVFVEKPGFQPWVSGPVGLEPGAVVDLGTIVLARERAIFGRVVSARGGPISGARVRALRAAGSSRRGAASEVFGPLPREATGETLTATDGSYSLHGLPAGVYDIEVLSPDHAPACRRDVLPGQGPIDFVLEEGLVIEGHVVDGVDRRPIQGARVRARPAQETTSDEGGAFRLSGLTSKDACVPGAGEKESFQVFLEVAAPGYRPRSSLVTCGAWRPLVEIELLPAPVLKGRVTTSEGAPVAGALLRLGFPGLPDARSLAVAASREDGSFRIEIEDTALWQLGRGAPRLIATHPKYAPAIVGPIRLSDRGGEDLGEIIVVLTGGGAIEGRVIGPAGEPIPGVRVDVIRARTFPEEVTALPTEPVPTSEPWVLAALRGQVELVASARSSAEGTFSASRIADGDYTLEVDNPPFALLSKTVRVEGGNATSVELRLAPGATIEGRVSDDEGRPVSGAMVFAIEHAKIALLDPRRLELILRECAGDRRAFAGADGRYVLERLPREPLLLVARAAGYEMDFRTGVLPEDGKLDFVLPRLASLAGRALDAETGAPVVSFSASLRLESFLSSARQLFPSPVQAVQWWNDAGRGLKVSTTEGGSFSFADLPAGSYALRVESAGYVPREQRIRLAPGERLELEVLLDRGFELAGTVVDAVSRGGVPGASVLLTLSAREPGGAGDRGLSLAAVSGPDGAFAFRGVPPGEARVAVRHPGYLRAESGPFPVSGDLRMEPVALEPAATLDVKILGLPRGPDGTELPVALFLERVDGTPVSVLFFRIDSGKSSTHRAVSVPPGEYVLKVTPSGYTTYAFGPLVLEAGRRASVEVQYTGKKIGS